MLILRRWKQINMVCIHNVVYPTAYSDFLQLLYSEAFYNQDSTCRLICITVPLLRHPLTDWFARLLPPQSSIIQGLLIISTFATVSYAYRFEIAASQLDWRGRLTLSQDPPLYICHPTQHDFSTIFHPFWQYAFFVAFCFSSVSYTDPFPVPV